MMTLLALTAVVICVVAEGMALPTTMSTTTSTSTNTETESKAKSAGLGQGSPPLLMISFDGFRWDYLKRTDTPSFDRIIKNGVTARYGLKNAFVTKTFPNHFTLVTGLWEESHGIVANDMYDPLLNQSFSLSNTSALDDPAWFSVGAEPIWVTNQLQTQIGRSGVNMWVGGGAPIKGVKPTRYVPFDGSIENKTKVDTMVEWFTDKYPINLGLLYFDQPDRFGHDFGPESPQVTRMIGGLDEVVGYLLEKLEEKGILDTINIIITSDHGFTETPAGNYINLDDFIDSNSYRMTEVTPIANIWPHDDKLETIYANLTAAAKENGNFDVYKQEDIPARYHYTHNRRISPIVVVAHDTFSFCTGSCSYKQLGNHGYDNRLQDMHPFFLAMGPSFKKNFAVDVFNNVDVYPLMCQLLGLNPAPNNGSLEMVSQLLLVKDEKTSLVTVMTYAIAMCVIACIAGLFIVGACRYHHYLRRTRNRQYNSLDTHDPSSVNNTSQINSKRAGTSSAEASSGSPTKFVETKVPLLSQDDENYS